MPLVEVLAGDGAGGGQARHRQARGDLGASSPGRRSTLQAEIWALAGREFTIGSPQQLGEVLFDELGLSRKRRGKTGYSTDARVLSQIRDEHEIVPKIERWREVTKLTNTYLDSLPGLIDPRTGASTRPSARCAPRPGGSRAPTRTSRTSRSAPSSAGRSAAASSPSRGRRADLLRLQPGRAPRAGARLRRRGAARDLRLRRGRPLGDRRRDHRRRPRGDHARRALEGEDGQLRDRLRAVRLRAGRPALDPPGGGRRPTSTATSSASPASSGSSTRRSSGPRGGLVQDPDGAPAADPRAALAQLADPHAGRAAGRQHGDPGHRRRHHQAGDDQLPPGARGRRASRSG